jgi:uncharacterized protein YycO
MLLLLAPAGAFAQPERSGWAELERYLGQEMRADPEALGRELQALKAAKKEHDRELTLEETEVREKCIDAQVVYNRTWRVGIQPTEEELAILSAAGEAVFGTPEEILKIVEETYVRMSPGLIAAQELPAIPKVDEDGILYEEQPSAAQELDLQPAPQDEAGQGAPLPDVGEASGAEGAATQLSSVPGNTEIWHPGGGYTTPLGTYPTRKGMLLVTSDWAGGLLPTGHAAIVYSGSSTRSDGIIESLSGGVTSNRNEWNIRNTDGFKYTCLGLDVTATSNAQEAAVAEWCNSKIGLPFNYNFTDILSTDAYYCSQLVWQGFYSLYGVNMNTTAWGTPVHPLELANNSYVAKLYRHGSALNNQWDNIGRAWYFIDSAGYPLKGGWRWTDNVNGWRYFGPTGVLCGTYQVSPGSMLDMDKRMDMGWSTTPGAQMQIWSHTGGDNERWNIFTMDGGTNWYIQSRYSEMYLAIPGGSIYNTAPVVQWTYTGGSEQKWRIVQYSDGSYQFRSALNTNCVIDVANGSAANGSKLQLYLHNGTPAQRWRYLDVW